MSELQLALLVLGVALVVAVWFYNRRVERQHRQRAAQLLPKTAPDTLMAGRPAPAAHSDTALHREPTIGGPAGALPPATALPEIDLPLEPGDAIQVDELTQAGPTEVDLLLDAEEGVDLLLDDVAAEPPAASAPTMPAPVASATPGARSVAPLPAEWADGQVDCLLRVDFPRPVAAGTLWAEHAAWSARIDKPLQWMGCDTDGSRWRTLFAQDTGHLRHLAVALQLVDRRGTVSEITLSALLDGVHRLAQRFGGEVALPERAALLGQAHRLDAFCASVDLQLSLFVLPKHTDLSGARLQPLIDAAGLRREGERFVATDAHGAEAFELTCQAATAFPIDQLDAMHLLGLGLSLDVPRVGDGATAFDRMIAFAQQCAEGLDAQLCDAHRKPLSPEMTAAIRGRIVDLQRQMGEHGIAAGSVRALRLFA